MSNLGPEKWEGRGQTLYISLTEETCSQEQCVSTKRRGALGTHCWWGCFRVYPLFLFMIHSVGFLWGKLLSPLKSSWSSPYSDVDFHWDFAVVVHQTRVSLIINSHSAFELLLQPLHQVLVVEILNILCAYVLLHTYPEKEVLTSGMLNWKRMMCFVNAWSN